ncbi:MAG: hypothetical protein MRY83_21360 [Flavobacteriales bacterium]|nr:hypothetical protein [Flavobacteriales bacterium]
MNADKYFGANNDFFWQWEEHGEVIAIPNSYTIAYTNQVVDLLEVLQPVSFPPFGSLILVLIACQERPFGKTDLNLKRLPELEYPNAEIDNAVGFLSLVNQLPMRFRTGPGLIELLRLLFADCHNSVGWKYRAALRHALGNRQVDFQLSEYNWNRLVESFRTINLIGKKYPSVESILNALQNIQPVDIELESNLIDPSLAPDLIDELSENPYTYKIGVLIPRIWGSLNIPYHSNVPSDQPLGGVSDITNKGDYNQLLFSEYANDDTLFMSRLANNEVLFYNREIPPQENNLERIILIDHSLKNWGVPKAIALSTGLAIARHPKSKIKCKIGLFGRDYSSVKMDTVEDVIITNSKLSNGLDNDKGLQQFFDKEDLRNKEVILISSDLAMQNAAFQKVLAENEHMVDFIIHTNDLAEISVFKISNKRKKFVQRFQLPIEELWAPKKDLEVKVRTGMHPGNFPLLFPNPNSYKQRFNYGNRVYKITKEKTLLINTFDKDNGIRKGWNMPNIQLPSTSSYCAAGVNALGEDLIMIFQTNTKEIYLLNCNTNVEKTVPFNDWKHSYYDQFFFKSGVFYYLHYNYFWTIDCEGNIIKHEKAPVELFKYFDNLKDQVESEWYLRGEELSILKNVGEVFINENGNLVFNIHELLLNSGGIIKLEPSSAKSKERIASQKNKGVFQFPDGSIIEVVRTGMLKLVSSDESIPEIYIPTTLDRHLGVCAGKAFAGNSYYLKEPAFNIKVQNPGGNKIEVVKGLKAFSFEPLSLKSAKGKLDDESFSVQVASKMDKTKLVKILSNSGASFEVEDLNSPFDVVSATHFFKEFIDQFVQNILNHGT